MTFWSGGQINRQNMIVAKTTNLGVDWTTYNITTGHTFALAVDPASSNIVYAGGNPGLYKTINGGSTWSSSSSGLTGYVYAIAINPETPTTLYAGTPNGVFKSTNSAASWTNTGGSLSDVKAILIHPGEPNTVYAGTGKAYDGTGSGIFISTQGGGNWTAMNDGLNEALNITSLGVDPVAEYLFAGTYGNGMYRWPYGPMGIEKEIKDKINNNAQLYHFNKNGFMIKVLKDGFYSISFYSVNGKLKTTLLKRLSAGSHQINFENGKLTNGVYLVELNNSQTVTRQKAILD